MIRVQLFRRGALVGDATCDGPACFLGRDEGSLLALAGWRIGRRQLQLEVRGGGIHVTDGGGIAPLKVNGLPHGEYGPLQPTDVIALHDYEVRAGMAAPAPAATPQLERRRIPRPDADTADADTAAACPLETQAGSAARAALHRKLIAAMDLRRLNVARMGDAELRAAVRTIIEEIVDTDPAFRPMQHWRSVLRDRVLDEVVGLGPLEALLADETVTEIMVNRHDDIFIERGGRLSRSTVTFSNDASVLAAIERIVAPLGRRIDESSPMVDARLKDGSRVNAVIQPVAIKGPSVTIRKFARRKLNADDLLRFGAISPAMVDFLQIAVEQRANIVISGGTGSGKTTLLNVLSGFIPMGERIVTVEDAAELQLAQPNLVALEARPPNIEGRGAITIRDLVRNCLRMRPDRIVVGECRGGEALDMLQAMNTGHDGSLTTAHANSPRDCVSRLEVMALMSGLDIPLQAIREQICSAVHLVVQQTRFACGTRRVTHITEVTGIEHNVVSMQDIFRFEQDGIGADGKVGGHFVPTGQVPDFLQDLMRRGIQVDMAMFVRDALPPSPLPPYRQRVPG